MPVAAFLPVKSEPKTFLIVDDHPAHVELLRLQLEAIGHTVLAAGNGLEALEVLELLEGKGERVNGIVSDILMPQMDGYSLCLQVRKSERFGALPFVLYSGTHNSAEDRELASAAGADVFIEKPAPVQTILAGLEAAASKHRSPATRIATPALEAPVLKQYSESLVRKLEEKSAELARAEARLSGMIEASLDAIVTVNERQNITLFNSAAETMFGCPRDEALSRGLNTFIPQQSHDEHRKQVELFDQSDPAAARPIGLRTVWGLRRDGTEFPIEASISTLDTSNGRLYTLFLRDITERYQAEQDRKEATFRIRRLNRVLSVLSAINALIVRTIDRDELLQEACRIAVKAGEFPKAWIGLVEGESKELRLAAGYGATEAFYQSLSDTLREDVLHGRSVAANALRKLAPVVINDMSRDRGALPDALSTGSRAVAVLPLIIEGKGVGVVAIHAEVAGFFDDEEMKLLRELAADISFALDHLRKAARIQYLANYDQLTSLPNRGLFSERLSLALQEQTDDDTILAVVLVDLERFRRINEALGRVAGDELLRHFASRLRQANASAARIGVDVFAVTLRDQQSVSEVARAFEDLAARCFSEPFNLAGEELRVECRGGIAVFPSDGLTAEALLRNAEAALRRAKSASEHSAFYAPDLNARAAEALTMESRLRRAIERNEFVLYYQPKITLADRHICGLEALIRWRDPESGLVLPGRFIPVLEESGQIGAVGEWALCEALMDQRRWRNAGLSAPRVAVNVSAMQLRKQEFADIIAKIMAANEGASLELEITESMIMEQVDRSIAALKQVQALGVSVAIDDFGTGYCSLSYVAKLPVNSLKIDRTFIIGMTESPDGFAIVSSIIALAHSLKLKVVAEGVETEEQEGLLRSLACDEAQGYLFSKPVPYDAIEELLRGGHGLATHKS